MNDGTFGHGIEIELEDGGVGALVCPAREGAAVILYAYRGAVIAGGLIVDNIATALLLKVPLGKVALLIAHKQSFIIAGRKIFTVVFKCVVASVNGNGEYESSVSGLSDAVCDGGGGRGHRGAHAVGHAYNALRGGIIYDDLIARLGQLSGFFGDSLAHELIECHAEICLSELGRAGVIHGEIVLGRIPLNVYIAVAACGLGAVHIV